MVNHVHNFNQFINESAKGESSKGETAEYNAMGDTSRLGFLEIGKKRIEVPYPEDELGKNLGKFEGYDEDEEKLMAWVCKIARANKIHSVYFPDDDVTKKC